MRLRSTVPALVVSTLLLSVAMAEVPDKVKAAEAAVDAEKIRAHVRFLADDLLEGRAPGQHGGDLAAQYIATQFALYGLKPGGDNGGYLQQVKFFGMTVKRDSSAMSLVPTGGAPIAIKFGPDYVVNNPRHETVAEIDAPIVFVGYGIIAPEFGWDDYAGIDVKGKVVLVIVGDPPSDDPRFFGGKTLTYYGRWTYKYEQAARKGAVGALIIHRTDLASYGWTVVEHSGSGEKTFLADDAKPVVEAAAWIHHDVADKLFASSNRGATDDEIAAAGKKGFKATELPIRLKAHIESVVRPYESPNVIGVLPGTSLGKDQALLYSAHYDHFGFTQGVAGDNIFNGAADNATGCGILLELARVWSQSGLKPPHSVIFASVTAEEQGLLGSEYLGQHPPIPAGQIALNLNYDMILPVGDPLETNVAGAERTSFFPVVETTAKRFKLAIVPDAHPEGGHYYRSDHFSMARVGVPSFSIGQGTLFVGHEAAWGLAKEDDYVAHRYHDFSDNYTPDMDFTGNAKLARFGIELGWQALSAPKSVEWKAGDEFEGARKISLGASPAQ